MVSIYYVYRQTRVDEQGETIKEIIFYKGRIIKPHLEFLGCSIKKLVFPIKYPITIINYEKLYTGASGDGI